MKSFFTLVLLLFCITLTAQDKIYIHTATSSNSSGNVTYINHPDLNSNPSAGLVFSHVWNPGGSGGTYNNKVTGLRYNSSSSRWAIYNEDLSGITIGSSYNVYIANPANVITHVSTLANQGSFGASSTVIDDSGFNNLNPGPYAVMSNYYNPSSVYNTQNYGFYYDLSLNRRTIYEEGANPIPTNAAFKILITGSGAGVARFTHQSTVGNITSNYTILDHPSLNNNPDAAFVFSHYWGVNGASSEVNIDKVLSVWYTGTRWAIYTEDSSAMPTGVTFDVIIAPVSTLTYVPDNNFEQALIDLGYDSGLDDYVLTENINTVTTLNVGNNAITDLTGIEDFTALTQLSCFTNQITSLDLSQNTALARLYCQDNQLVSLDVSQNTLLTTLRVNDNLLTSLDLSSNTALINLWCNNNQLTSLDVRNGNNTNVVNFYSANNPNLPCIEVDNATYSTTNWLNIDPASSFNENCSTYVPDNNFEQALIDLGYDTVLDDYVLTANINTVTNLNVSGRNIADLTGIEDFVALTFLNSDNNILTDLDISQNLALNTLFCGNNQLTSLDITQNTALTGLYCYNNQLTNLDLALNTALTNLDCFNNQLSSLDVTQNTALTQLYCHQNQLTSLNVKNGNNTIITAFNSTNNPNLICIEVDDAIWSTANWTLIDPVSSFSEDCSLTTYVPDNNFEQALIDLGYDIVLDDFVFTTNINTITNLNVSGRSIADLTGIEDFTALQVLDCYNNLLTSLDVSQNLALTGLYCYVNQLASLNLNLNTALQTLICSSNQLTSLDLTQNTALTSFSCGNNLLTSLDLTLNTALTELWCYDNQLTSLSLRNGNNALIVQYNSTNNPNLTCIEVDNPTWSATNWGNIDAQSYFATDCNFTYVPDNNFEAYLEANSMGNGIANDDYVLTSNINTIIGLDVNSENIADLTGIEGFTALEFLYCGNNQLTNLDITQNISLTYLYCSINQLTNLDTSLNTALEYLFCDYNQLVSLDVSQNTTLIELQCFNNQLTSLNVKNGNNTSITNFNSTVNPNLTCIEVDNTAWSTTNWTNIDPASSFSDNCYYFETYVPDDNFEAYLEANGMGNGIANDDYVLTANINTVTFLNISAQNIANITGIEDFIALEILFCSNNLLTNIDISQNTALTNLWCDNNSLTSLDVSQNLALTELICGNNQLTSLNVSVNSSLSYLDAEMNQITHLDLAQNTALTYLNCQFNQLIRLDVRNGNNTNVTYFNAMVNPPLTCIEVDDAIYSTANWTNISAGMFFNEGCYTYVPDDNFEQALIDFGYDTVLDDYVLTANINTITTLNVSGRSITNLIGIENFIALENLLCYSNSLTNLDLSQNTALIDVRCYNNQLINLNVTQNTLLTYLNCDNNQLSNLDVTQSTELDYFSCRSNQLTSLDLSTNTVLTLLTCNDNLLTNLDLTQNTALDNLWTHNNQLTSLDLSQNTSLTRLRCENNQLTSLNLQNGNNTNIVLFDARTNPNLTCIEVDDAAYSTANWTNIDSWASFNENCALSVSELGLENQISIYPNPTTNEFRVKALQEDSRLEIYNLNGVLVFKQQNYKGSTINVSNLSSSVYFVKISNNSDACVKRLIIE